METHEKITEKRIEKIEKELEKVRKENKKMEYTNQMYGLLNGEEMPNSRHLKISTISTKTHEEGSISNAPQPTAGPMDSGGTNFDMSWALLLAPPRALLIFPVTPTSMFLSDGSINGSFKRSCSNTSIHVPFEDSSSNGSTYVSFTGSFLLSSQRYPEMAYPILPTTMAYPMPSPMITPPMSNLVFPPRTTNRLLMNTSMSASCQCQWIIVDGSLGIPRVLHFLKAKDSLNLVPRCNSNIDDSSHSPLMVPSLLSSQRYPKWPIQSFQQQWLINAFTDDYSSMSNLVVFLQSKHFKYPLMNIPSISASVPMDNNVDGSLGIPQSPSFSELLSLNDDEIMTLLDDTSFNINVQDPNHHHRNNL
ncbi:hypothetical protein H5410_004265 [Solanum commersonii]|uniref:Uncharacterized protein n=1 Tax=Solanum commersonii TaxID=4109 RepID=A0A9J6B7M0_SOLCO|nr:hypothetical protein H5410_004265 [Solanum commersonii]